MANYMKIKQYDVANGEGIRTSIFFSGCEFKCKGCFNVEAWGFDAGEPFTRKVYEEQIKPTINEHISGISILGGEPLHTRNIISVYPLMKWFKEDFPNKTIWLWSGYTFEELIYDYKNILSMTDVLIDGQYIEEQRDLTLKWRGSKNQRVINVQQSLQQNKLVLYTD